MTSKIRDSIAKTTSARLNRAQQSKPLRPLSLESTVKREYTEQQHPTLPSRTPESDRHTQLSRPMSQNIHDMQDNEIRQEEEQYKESQMYLHDVEKHGEQNIHDFYKEKNRYVAGGISKIEDKQDEEIQREEEVQAYLHDQTYDDVRYYDKTERARRREEYERSKRQREEEQYWIRYYHKQGLRQRQLEIQRKQAQQRLTQKSTQPPQRLQHTQLQNQIPPIQSQNTNLTQTSTSTQKTDDKMHITQTTHCKQQAAEQL